MFKQAAEATHKVIMLGDSQAGKTSIICRQVLGYEPSDQMPTIGCSCNEINIGLNDHSVTLQLWDTAGQESYRSLVPIYSRGAEWAIIVFDVTSMHSFENLGVWFNLVESTMGNAQKVVMAANKIDLKDTARVPDDMIDDFAGRRGVKWFKTSAVTGEGLASLFLEVAHQVETVKCTKNYEAVNLKERDKNDSGCC